MSENIDDTEKKLDRGFRVMSPEKRREIASMGGKAAHAKGTAHRFSHEQVREAGRNGGLANAGRTHERKHDSDGQRSTIVG